MQKEKRPSYPFHYNKYNNNVSTNQDTEQNNTIVDKKKKQKNKNKNCSYLA